MQKINLSVVVSAYNEEKNIEDCLKSVKFADEIIVVNNASTDSTEKIVKKYTQKIYTVPNNLMLNVNKNKGFERAKGTWILSLDADERVTEDLQKEIKNVLQSNTEEINGYWIPRKNIIFGKWIQNSMWWPDYQLRLFKSKKGKFPERHVHEYLEVEGKTVQLQNPLIHMNYTSISQYIQKMEKIYTNSEVENLMKEGKGISWIDAIRFPVNDFIKTFFAQKGYKDGLHGLVLSMFQAFYSEIVFAKLWEKQGFNEEYPTVSDIGKEIKKTMLETKYWLYTIFIDEEKSKFQLYKYKLLRRKIKKTLDSLL